MQQHQVSVELKIAGDVFRKKIEIGAFNNSSHCFVIAGKGGDEGGYISGSIIGGINGNHNYGKKKFVADEYVWLW